MKKNYQHRHQKYQPQASTQLHMSGNTSNTSRTSSRPPHTTKQASLSLLASDCMAGTSNNDDKNSIDLTPDLTINWLWLSKLNFLLNVCNQGSDHTILASLIIFLKNEKVSQWKQSLNITLFVSLFVRLCGCDARLISDLLSQLEC